MPDETTQLLADAAYAVQALREYIEAIPSDVAASFPAMPGIDGDWLDELQGRLTASGGGKG